MGEPLVLPVRILKLLVLKSKWKLNFLRNTTFTTTILGLPQTLHWVFTLGWWRISLLCRRGIFLLTWVLPHLVCHILLSEFWLPGMGQNWATGKNTTWHSCKNWPVFQPFVVGDSAKTQTNCTMQNSVVFLSPNVRQGCTMVQINSNNFFSENKVQQIFQQMQDLNYSQKHFQLWFQNENIEFQTKHGCHTLSHKDVNRNQRKANRMICRN